jgi:hypothetical protein
VLVKKYRAFVKILFTFLLFQNQVNAEINPMLGTLETRYRELSYAGNLSGCELSFETIAQDFAYNHGGEIVGIGSISVNSVESKSGIILGIFIKLGLLEKFIGQNSETEITAPNYVFIKSKNFNSSRQPYASVESDTKGYTLIALKDYIESIKLLDDVIQEGNFTIGFNKKENGMDVYLPVDITVKETITNDGSFKRIHSNDALSNFTTCFSKMLEKVSKQ